MPYDYIVFLQEHEFDIVTVEDDPINFRQALESSKSQEWIDAMNEEIKSMKDNDVWYLVPLPEGVKPIGCKWIFKTKRDSKGDVERYKTRLIAKDYTQKEGIDYKETFSPVSSKDSFRTIMALVVHFDLELHQMDVKTVFLNGDIDETIYMVQPENFVSGVTKRMVCKLKKSIYGLDAGASINTQNIGNSALIIEELDWGGQDTLNTCENSFFGPHLGLGRQKTWSDLDKFLMWSCHIYFRKFALFI